MTPLLVVAPYLDRTLEGQPVRERLAELGCELEADTELVSIGRDSCILRRYGQAREVAASTVVLASARRSNDGLQRELRNEPTALERAGVEALYAIGDCVAPRLIADCIFDGHRLARELDSPNPTRPLPFIRERHLHATLPNASPEHAPAFSGGTRGGSS